MLSVVVISSSFFVFLLLVFQRYTSELHQGPHKNETLITVYDANDLLIPPTAPDSFFVATRIHKTPVQSRGVCGGNDNTVTILSRARLSSGSLRSSLPAFHSFFFVAFFSLHLFCSFLFFLYCSLLFFCLSLLPFCFWVDGDLHYVE